LREKYQRDKFDPKAKLEEVEAAYEKVEKALKGFYTPLGELNTYHAALGNEAAMILSCIPSREHLEKELARVFPWFPFGASGEKLAAAIGEYGIDSKAISDLFMEPGQTVLLRKGELAETRYFPAGPDDAEAIAKAQAEVESAREAYKAKREAKKGAKK